MLAEADEWKSESLPEKLKSDRPVLCLGGLVIVFWIVSRGIHKIIRQMLDDNPMLLASTHVNRLLNKGHF
jgi:hypothetical protein